jgi:hypothetical protein
MLLVKTTRNSEVEVQQVIGEGFVKMTIKVLVVTKAVTEGILIGVGFIDKEKYTDLIGPRCHEK